MAEERSYTIGELAQRAGVTPRTIRYYTAEGLLPQPDTRGRYARYSHAHVERLEQIARLKEQYLPLNVIRERLAGGAVAGTASGTPVSAASPLSLSLPSPSALHAPARSAVARRGAEPLRAGAGAAMDSGAQGESAQPLRLGQFQFFPDLPEPPETQDSDLAAPERWQRVTLALGVELHFREPLSPERRRRLEALIAAAQDQLSEERSSP